MGEVDTQPLCNVTSLFPIFVLTSIITNTECSVFFFFTVVCLFVLLVPDQKVFLFSFPKDISTW